MEFAYTFGGPVLVIERRHANAWWGAFNEAGQHVFEKEPTHYDLACKAEDEVGFVNVPGRPGVRALVLGSPDGTALHRLENGALLVRWVGASSEEGLLAGALRVQAFEEAGTWALDGDELWAFDSRVT